MPVELNIRITREIKQIFDATRILLYYGIIYKVSFKIGRWNGTTGARLGKPDLI